MRKLMVAIALGMVFQSSGYARIFTNLQGKKISGEIESVSGDRVEMTVNNKRFIFPISTLVKEDQEFIKEWAKENKSYRLSFTADGNEDPNGRTEGQSLGPGRNGANTRAKAGSEMKGSKWKYSVRIENRSGDNLENLTVKYVVAVRTTISDSAKTGRERSTESFDVKEGMTTVPLIENSKAAQISTDWIECTETKWEERRVIHKRDSDGDAYTEEILAKLKEDMEIDGIRIKVFLGDQEIAEWESQGKMIKDVVWAPNAGGVGKDALPIKLLPIGSQGKVSSAAPVLFHEDLEPIPAALAKFKGVKAHSELWFAVVRLGRDYASSSEKRQGKSDLRKIKTEYDEALRVYVAANQ